MSALWPLQQALVARWKGDGPLTDRITGVWAGLPPTGALPPYIVVGEKTEVRRVVFGWETTVTAHVWSAIRGSDEEALEIVGLMHAAVNAPLTMAGFGSAELIPEFTTTLIDEGFRHVPVRYRALLVEA